MPTETIKFPIIAGLAPLQDGSLIAASVLPQTLTIDEAFALVDGIPLCGPDLQSGSTALWFLDKSVTFRNPPAIVNTISQKKGPPLSTYSFQVGRDLSHSMVAFPYAFISRIHLDLFLSPDLVTIHNWSTTSNIMVGGAMLMAGNPQDLANAVGDKVMIKPDAPFVIGFPSKNGIRNGILVAPLSNKLDALHKQEASDLAVARIYPRRPWWTFFQDSPYGSFVNKHLGQATRVDQKLVTPPQFRNLDDLRRSDAPAEISVEGKSVRATISEWLQNGRLDLHVKGYKKMDGRLLENVRRVGNLLFTHSTDLSGAVSILNDGFLDPKKNRHGTVHFRYGLGHSYCGIVFVKVPRADDIERVHDMWWTLSKALEAPDERQKRVGAYNLVSNVDYNRNIPVKDQSESEDDSKLGQSVIFSHNLTPKIMEMYPQLDLSERVSMDDILTILVPEHLHGELMSKIPSHLRDKIIKIPGTGRTEKEFLEGREEIGRRSRSYGGKFEPMVGKNALFRYELTYFKIVEILSRYRHRALRQRVDGLARAAASDTNLTYLQVVDQIAELAAFLPEAFRVLNLQQQFPSHDRLSPMLHTLNALVESAYLAPTLAREFPDISFEDAFMALLFHDLGKVKGGTDANHGKHSIELAKFHMKLMGIDKVRADKILALIERSGLLSEASIAIDKGTSPKKAYDLVRPRLEGLLPLIFMVNFADVASIPGRSGREMRANKDYTAVTDVRPNLIRVFRDLQDPS